MASIPDHITVDVSDRFSEVLSQAQEDFRRLHTELTDDIKKLIAEEVKRQLAKEVLKQGMHRRHNPVQEVK